MATTQPASDAPLLIVNGTIASIIRASEARLGAGALDRVLVTCADAGALRPGQAVDLLTLQAPASSSPVRLELIAQTVRDELMSTFLAQPGIADAIAVQVVQIVKEHLV